MRDASLSALGIAFMHIEYTEQELKLADEIATTLNDWKALQMHRQYARLYKESCLREKLAVVMATPDRRILTTRAKYYTYLVNLPDKDGARA